MSSELPGIRVRRHPERGHYDKDTLYPIIDEAWHCHVGVVRDGMPIIIPTLHVRVDDTLYVHGAVAAGLFKDLAHNAPVSVAITHLDGLVLARSLYNHSANYRSVVVFGVPSEVTDPDLKLTVLKALSDRVAPGRWEDARQPNAIELKQTRIFAVPLTHASAKIRTGPVADDPEDLDRPTWAGVLPLRTVFGEPEADAGDRPSVPLPDYLERMMQSHA